MPGTINVAVPQKTSGGAQDPEIVRVSGASVVKKDKEIKNLKDENTKLKQDLKGVYTDTQGNPTGAQIGDKTYLGLNLDDLDLLGQQQAGIQERENRIMTNLGGPIKDRPAQTKEEALASVPVPRAEDVVGRTIGNFEDFTEQGSRQGLIQGTPLRFLLDSNLGEGFVGKGFADALKDNDFSGQIMTMTKYMNENNLSPEQVSDDPYTQGILRLNLNENDLKILKEGKADVSKMAVAVEGLPVSSQITKWTGGALTPTSAFNKIGDLDEQVKQITSKMDNWNEAITRNPQLAGQYESLIEESEETLTDLQSRIKLMVIQSPILQNSPEEVENIMQDLDRAFTKTTKLKSVVIQTRGY